MYFRESVSKKKEKKKKSVTRNTWINNKYLEFLKVDNFFKNRKNQRY